MPAQTACGGRRGGTPSSCRARSRSLCATPAAARRWRSPPPPSSLWTPPPPAPPRRRLHRRSLVHRHGPGPIRTCEMGRRDGFIVVAVLWLLGALATLAAVYAAYVGT